MNHLEHLNIKTFHACFKIYILKIVLREHINHQIFKKTLIKFLILYQRNYDFISSNSELIEKAYVQ